MLFVVFAAPMSAQMITVTPGDDSSPGGHPRRYLFGDWGGARSNLEEKGIRISRSHDRVLLALIYGASQSLRKRLVFGRAEIRQRRFVRSMAMEYAKHAIRFNAAAPGIDDTPMHTVAPRGFLKGLSPMGEIVGVDDIVHAVL